MVCHSLCNDGLAADKLQSHLRQRVSLAEHGHGALSENLLAREFGHFRGDVHVADTRFGGLQVFSLDVQVGNGVLKAILHGAKVRANLVLGDDGLVQGFKGFLGLSLLLARWAVGPVARAWERQREFVADASHELKTPLTVILSNAQLLAEADGDAALRERLTSNILAMSARMRGLVEDLLELARVDTGPQAQDMQVLDLSRLTAEALLPFEPLFYERGLTLESELEPGIRVRGSAAQLTQCVGILLDNACKYASEHGHALVRLRRQGRRACLLSVENSGEPLSAREQRDIFKRFYRADRSRTGGSFGLGLAIARGIAGAHRGRIWAEAFEGGNRFCLRLRVQK